MNVSVISKSSFLNKIKSANLLFSILPILSSKPIMRAGTKLAAIETWLIDFFEYFR